MRKNNMSIFPAEIKEMKSKSFGTAIAAAAVLAIFLALYFYMASGMLRQVMIYFLIIAGLYFSVSWVHASSVAGAVGALLLIFEGAREWPVTTGGLILMLAGTAVVPYFYERLSKLSRMEYLKTNSSLKQKISGLDSELLSLEKERNSLEHEIDKINQLYILGRELVERMEIEEVLEHLERILLNRPGVNNVGIFSWDNDKWKVLSCSDQELRDRLLVFVNGQKQLRNEKEIKQLQAPEYLEGKSIVFWPVRLEKDLMAGVLIIAENKAAGRYVEEGAIFIPQIALGLKRTRLFAEVRERSRADGLTGLYLRRYFIERLQTEIQRAKRYTGIFSILVLDLDFFKKVNDTYGHIIGDKVLCGVSRIFIDCLRPGDLVGRYGGEEFIVLIPMAEREEILYIAKEINRLVSEKEFSAENEKFHVSISIGISHYPQDGASVEALISSADQALYWVKTERQKRHKGIRRDKPKTPGPPKE